MISSIEKMNMKHGNDVMNWSCRGLLSGSCSRRPWFHFQCLPTAEILNLLSQKGHSSPPMTSTMTVGKLLQSVQQHVQHILRNTASTHILRTTLL